MRQQRQLESRYVPGLRPPIALVLVSTYGAGSLKLTLHLAGPSAAASRPQRTSSSEDGCSAVERTQMAIAR